MTVVAGDLGGTKTLLGLYEGRDLLYKQHFDSRAHEGLDAMVAAFLGDPEVRRHERPRRAAIGVAGPVVGKAGERQRAQVTNLSYAVDTDAVVAATGLEGVRLYNDFYTVAASVRILAPEDICALNPRAEADPAGVVAILGAGTGLGEAVLVPVEGKDLILPSEGGHTDLAARDEVEIALLRFLMRRHGDHVSYERVLSGAGLLALYEFFRELRGAPADAPELTEPAQVSEHGLRGDDPLSVEALERFVFFYGAEAGNLALKVLARGGVYVSGGIAGKILPRMADGTFMRGFLHKGRFAKVLERIPVHVIMTPLAGLHGAARLAGC